LVSEHKQTTGQIFSEELILLLRKDDYQKLFSMLVRLSCFFSGEGGRWYNISLKNEWTVSGTKAVNEYVSLPIYATLSSECVVKPMLSFHSIKSVQ
jgi:hypothetical protein